MKSRSRFLGSIFNKVHQRKIDVNVDLIEYTEDGIFYVYSPALDLVGYGASQLEARNSWETVLGEYFRYTLNKKTLEKDLESRGWNIKHSKSYYTPPTLSWMLQKNDGLSDIYNKHDFQKVTKQIKVPLQESYV